MRRSLVPVTVIAMVATAGLALAVPAGKTLTFEGKGMGRVAFSGDVHAKAGPTCNKCHNKDMFAMMKKGRVEFKMADIQAGRFCGVCHNGTAAFAPSGNCTKCHKK